MPKDYAATATWKGAPKRGDRPVALVDIGEILGVQPATPYTWSHRGVLPPHAGLLGRSRYWWLSDIEAWYADRVRRGIPDDEDDLAA